MPWLGTWDIIPLNLAHDDVFVPSPSSWMFVYGLIPSFTLVGETPLLIRHALNLPALHFKEQLLQRKIESKVRKTTTNEMKTLLNYIYT